MEELFNKWNYLCQKKEQVKQLLNRNATDVVFYMIFLRLFPATPSWVMNLILPHLGVSHTSFIITTFIGMGPWNYFTCESGSILTTLASTGDIMTKEKYIEVSIVFVIFYYKFIFIKTFFFS